MVCESMGFFAVAVAQGERWRERRVQQVLKPESGILHDHPVKLLRIFDEHKMLATLGFFENFEL
jgi:hypothetical protein